jgi:hypothetical protein
MTKLRNIVGIALVAMSMLTGLAVTSAPAQDPCLSTIRFYSTRLLCIFAPGTCFAFAG